MKDALLAMTRKRIMFPSQVYFICCTEDFFLLKYLVHCEQTWVIDHMLVRMCMCVYVE